MEDLPKIVRQRLRVAAAPGVHPRADLLTAFAEKALTERERIRVVEHLSRCEDCREVVFLAAPPEAPAQVVEKHPHGEPWLGWPSLRWGTALACVVVVGTAVTLYREGQNHGEVFVRMASDKANSRAPMSSAADAGNVASQAEPGSPAPPRYGVTAATVAPPKSASSKSGASNLGASNKDAGARQSEAKEESPVRPGRKAMTATPRVRMQFDQSRQILDQTREINENGVATDREAASTGAVADRSAAAAPAALAKGGTVAAAPSANGQMQTPAAASQYTAAADSAGDSVEAGPSGPGLSDSGKTVTKTDHPTGSGTIGGPIVASSPVGATAEKRNSAGLQKKALARASSRLETVWMLTPAGALQRSDDAGKTWEMAAIPGQGPFRALAAAGSEVWLGDAGGVLYHSSDTGLHWARVIPQANGLAPSGGITRIEFQDLQNGRVTTATGEIWTTSDAGKTWQKN
jgi:hypothetical protein